MSSAQGQDVEAVGREWSLFYTTLPFHSSNSVYLYYGHFAEDALTPDRKGSLQPVVQLLSFPCEHCAIARVLVAFRRTGMLSGKMGREFFATRPELSALPATCDTDLAVSLRGFDLRRQMQGRQAARDIAGLKKSKGSSGKRLAKGEKTEGFRGGGSVEGSRDVDAAKVIALAG